MPEWKSSKGGRLVKLGYKMGRCMKKVENHWSKQIDLLISCYVHTLK